MTINGNLLDPAYTVQPENYSSDLAAVAMYAWPISAGYQNSGLISGTQGAITNLTGITPGRIGVGGASFIDQWYNHIHITPDPLALGNLLSNQTRTVEVWNAFFTNATLNTVTPANDTGLVLNQPASPPLIYPPLAARTYSLQISTIGPATIAATYTFSFNLETAVLVVTGVRTIIFSMLPDWSKPMTERLEWMTEVMTSRGGYEQRVQLRQVPRRTLEYDILAYETDYQYLDSLIAGWQSRVYAVPIWTDQLTLHTDLPQASTSIVLGDLTGLDFYAGGLIILGSDARNNEGAQVTAVTVTGISPNIVTTLTLQKPTGNDWPPGSYIVPARTAQMAQSQNVTRPTAKVSQLTMQWKVIDNSNQIYTATESTQTLGGVGVYLTPPDRSEDVSVTYARLSTEIDYKIGVFQVDDIPQRPFIVRSHKYLLSDRASILAFKNWLYYRVGQLVPYYQPTWERNLEVTETIGATSSTITVLNQAFSTLFNGLPGRDHVAFLHNNGNWYLFPIVGFGPLSATEELMTITGSFGFIVNPGDIQMAMFLEYSRLNSDAVEFSWETNSVAYAKIASKKVTQ